MTRRRGKDSKPTELGRQTGPDISTPESRVFAAAALAHPKLDRDGYRRSWAKRVSPLPWSLRIWRSRKAS